MSDIARQATLAFVAETKLLVYNDIFTTKVRNDLFFAGIYTTNSPEAVRYVVEHSRANFVVVEDQEQLDKVLLDFDFDVMVGVGMWVG